MLDPWDISVQRGDRPRPHGRSVVGPGRLLRGSRVPPGRVLPGRARVPPRRHRAPRAPSRRDGGDALGRQRPRPGLVPVPGTSGRALLSLLLPSARNRPNFDRESDRLCLCGGDRCLRCRHRRRAARSGGGSGDHGRALWRAARFVRPRPVQGPRTNCAPRDPPGTRHRGRDRRVRLRDRILQCDVRVARADLPRTGVFDTFPSRRFASRRRMALPRPLAAASHHDFADRGRRHSWIRRLQLRGPARGYNCRRDRRGAVLGRSDRLRRGAPARAPALGAMGRHRPGQAHRTVRHAVNPNGSWRNPGDSGARGGALEKRAHLEAPGADGAGRLGRALRLLPAGCLGRAWAWCWAA